MQDVELKLGAFEEAARGWSYPSHLSRELVTILEPESKAAREIASIVSQIQHMHVDAGVQTFCFLADESGRGTSVVAANVAAIFAQRGKRAILLDLNFSAPRLGEMFGLDPSKPGLADWLVRAGAALSWTAYAQPAYPNLVVMPVGKAVKEGLPFLASDLRPLILDMSRAFDIVICDAPPVSDVAGMLAAVSAVERSILVARANATKIHRLLEFQELVKQCGATLGGAVYLDF